MAFPSLITVLITEVRDLSFVRWFLQWANLGLLRIVVVVLLFSKKIFPNTQVWKEYLSSQSEKKVYIWQLATWILLLFANDVPCKCLGTIEKAFTDSNIVLQITSHWFLLCPCFSAWYFSLYLIPYNKILLIETRKNHLLVQPPWTFPSLWSCCGPWIKWSL